MFPAPALNSSLVWKSGNGLEFLNTQKVLELFSKSLEFSSRANQTSDGNRIEN